MRQALRTEGFTLIEVALAIVLGVIMVAGSAALYQQARISYQNAAARQKTQALAIVVEELEARSSVLPGLDQLRLTWQNRRADDYDRSPWGGTLTGNFIEGKDDVGPNVEIGHGVGGTPHAGATLADRGRLYYFRRKPADSGPPYLWMDELDLYEPEDTQARFRLTGYGVALLDAEGRQWFYVAGKGKTNAVNTGPFDTEGQVGN